MSRLAERASRLGGDPLGALHIVWGERDRVIPPSYAERFARGIGSAADVLRIPRAGHLVDLDRPEELAQAIEAFLGRGRS